MCTVPLWLPDTPLGWEVCEPVLRLARFLFLVPVTSILAPRTYVPDVRRFDVQFGPYAEGCYVF